jgi:zinc transport system permease protein
MIDFADLSFLRYALLAGVSIALCCSILGVFLVLRRLALLGEGLAHFAFGTIGLGLLWKVYPFLVTLPLALGASIWIMHLAGRAQLVADAGIGLISAVGMAVGVILASKSTGFNLDLFGYLFGDILAVSLWEALAAAALSLAVLWVVIKFYDDFFALTFDENYARVLGIPTKRLDALLALASAITVILGIKLVGTMLVASLILFPPITAMQWGGGFKQTMIFSAAVGVFSVFVGMLIAFIWDLPAGAAIVMVNFFLFLNSYLIQSVRRSRSA